MPRDTSGTYLLPSGNPVASNTIIESAWANSTLTDIGQALTESLDRYGRSTMQKELYIVDGTALKPGLAFGAETTTGLFRKATQVLGFSVGTTEVASFSPVSGMLNVPMTLAGGLVGDITLTNGNLKLADDKEIIWGDGSTVIQGNSTSDLVIISTREVDVVGNLVVKGAAPFPTFTASSMYFNGAPGLGFFYAAGAADSKVWDIYTDSTRLHGRVVNDANTGATEWLTVVRAGMAVSTIALTTTSAAFGVGNGVVNSTVPYWGPMGSAASPAYSFASAATTGMFSPGSGSIAFSGATVEKMRLTGGADSQLLIGTTTATGGGGGRGVLELNGAASALFNIDVAGAQFAALYVDAGTFSINAIKPGVPISLFTGGAEKARITSAAQAELLVGTSTPQFSASNRGLVEINGNQSVVLGFDINGASFSYLYSQGTTFGIYAASTTTAVSLGMLGINKLTVTNTALTDAINNQELGWRDIPAYTINYASGGLIPRGGLIPVTATFTLVQQATNGTYCLCNITDSAVTIGASGVTLHLAGTTLVGNRTLAPRGFATIWFQSAGEAYIMGNVS